MIKTILVPASGSSTDTSVFATALALARPLGAHLEFYHVRVPSTEAAVRTPHLDYCAGPALAEALEAVRRKERELAASAADHFQAFCRDNTVPIRESPLPVPPDGAGEVSAHWIEETDIAGEPLMRHARHCDLVVLGRPRHRDYMPVMLIQDLLAGCGRPCVIAPHSSPSSVTGTIVVGWKETKEAARALMAAYPLLERAGRVILLSLCEAGGTEESAVAAALAQLAEQLKWHGIVAQTRVMANRSEHATTQLARAALELKADMLVAGGFGHGRLRELIFGGVTQSLVDHADLPVFMLH